MIVTWSRGTANEHMPEDISTELADMMNRHPWWRARARLALAFLAAADIMPPARVLDAGCGSGASLEALERRGYAVTGLDISRKALERIDRVDRMLIEADLTRCQAPAIEPFDAVLLLDVIEHLDDEKVVLHALSGLLKPGGLAVISVPARPDLLSEFDRIQGHRRRYTPGSLASIFAATGLEVREILWWGYVMVPALRFQRRGKSRSGPAEPPLTIYRRYLRLPPWPAAWLLDLALAWDHRRTLKRKNPTGTSLIALATRSSETP
jgi:SAM-dependent methyltransferase